MACRVSGSLKTGLWELLPFSACPPGMCGILPGRLGESSSSGFVAEVFPATSVLLCHGEMATGVYKEEHRLLHAAPCGGRGLGAPLMERPQAATAWFLSNVLWVDDGSPLAVPGGSLGLALDTALIPGRGGGRLSPAPHLGYPPCCTLGRKSPFFQGALTFTE